MLKVEKKSQDRNLDPVLPFSSRRKSSHPPNPHSFQKRHRFRGQGRRKKRQAFKKQLQSLQTDIHTKKHLPKDQRPSSKNLVSPEENLSNSSTPGMRQNGVMSPHPRYHRHVVGSYRNDEQKREVCRDLYGGSNGGAISELSGESIFQDRTIDSEELSYMQKEVEREKKFRKSGRNSRPKVNDLMVFLLLAIEVGFTAKGMYDTIQQGNLIATFVLAMLIPSLILISFYFFKFIVWGIFNVFGPTRPVFQNSLYYSFHKPEIPPVLPTVTVQMPVYKEGLLKVIKPSLLNILDAVKFYESHGGKANVFVNDDGMQALDTKTRRRRERFYNRHGIGYVARPREGRKGLFKKASNMNYCLGVSEDIRSAMEEENIPYEEAKLIVLQRYGGEFIIGGGEVLIGDLILLVDSDTRIPVSSIHDTVGEFTDEKVGFTQHLTTAMKISGSYWQNSVAFFTNQIYTLGIRLACSLGDPCPLVGHNTFIKWSVVKKGAFIDPEDQKLKYWTETNVSEDFELSLKMATKGYIGRYCTYTGFGFQEGVSLSFHDEMMRLQKYAYGACETIFQRPSEWIERKSFFSPIFKEFMLCKAVPFSAKINIISYLGSYFAMASAFFLLVLWMTGLAFSPEYLNGLERPMNVWTTVVFVFSVFIPVTTVIVQYRLELSEHNHIFRDMWQQIKYIPLISLLFGGVLFHLTTSCLAFIFGTKIVWGATMKEIPETNFFLEMKLIFARYWKMYLTMAFLLIYWGTLLYLDRLAINSNVSVPALLYICYHMIAPIFLNPYIMKFQY